MDTQRYKTTRFITYVKRYYKEAEDDADYMAFAKWLIAHPYSTTNMHAGVEQMIFFIHGQAPADDVKRGFVKWCIVYQQDPSNLLPKHLKKSPEIIASYASIVFEETLDVD